MTKDKIRAALASVPGFKPVKTVTLKLLVISMPVLGCLFLIGLFYLNFYYLLPRLFTNRKLYLSRHLPDRVENDHLYIVNLKIELDHES